MYKLVAIFALVAASMAAPKPSLVAYSPAVVSPVVSHVPVAYSSQSSSVVHSAPVVYPAHLVHSVPVASAPVVHSVPLAYSGLQTVYV